MQQKALFAILEDIKQHIEKKINLLATGIQQHREKNPIDQPKNYIRLQMDALVIENNIREFGSEINKIRDQSTKSAYHIYRTRYLNELQSHQKEIMQLPNVRVFEEKKESEKAFNIQTMQKMDVVCLGREIQSESKQKAIDALKEANSAKQIADDLHVQLLEQRNKLEYIESVEDEMESTMKRIGGHLRYFARNFLTDKLIIVLIVLIVIAIVAIIVVKRIYPMLVETQDNISPA